MNVPTRPSGLRDMTRRSVQAQIAEQATALFIEHGFAETTLEQIAAAVGISSRSVSRYFKTKEDIVLGNMVAVGEDVTSALRERPRKENPWVSLRRALDVSVNFIVNDSAGVRAARMQMETPALRSAMQEKQRAWSALLVPDVMERLGGGSDESLRIRAEAMVGCALSCQDVAVTAWTRGGNAMPLGDYLDIAFDALRR
jgi:AcrR family transcriptional regulator